MLWSDADNISMVDKGMVNMVRYKKPGMMGCLICSQDAGPGFPFLDRTDTGASVTVFLILSTPTNLIVDIPYEEQASQMALILMRNPFRSLDIYLISRYIFH